MELQVRSTKDGEGFEVIVTKDNKLIWLSSYFFYNKQEALDFVETCSKQVFDDYERCQLCQIEDQK